MRRQEAGLTQSTWFRWKRSGRSWSKWHQQSDARRRAAQCGAWAPTPELEWRQPSVIDDDSCKRCLNYLDGNPSGDGWMGWFRWRAPHRSWTKWHISKNGDWCTCGASVREPDVLFDNQNDPPPEANICKRCQRQPREEASPMEALLNAADAFMQLFG